MKNENIVNEKEMKRREQICRKCKFFTSKEECDLGPGYPVIVHPYCSRYDEVKEV